MNSAIRGIHSYVHDVFQENIIIVIIFINNVIIILEIQYQYLTYETINSKQYLYIELEQYDPIKVIADSVYVSIDVRIMKQLLFSLCKED